MTGGARADAEQRVIGQIVALGRLLGFEVEVGAHADWEVLPDRVRVGLGFYRALGFDDEVAPILALRDLWARVRAPRAEPGRAARHRRIAAALPEVSPLLIAIDRIDADRELAEAMPGIAAELRAAACGSFGADLQGQPETVQWIGAVTRFVSDGRRTLVDPRVDAEFEALLSAGGQRGAALLRACQAAPGRSAVDRLDRCLALLAPPLLSLTGGGSGLTASGDGAAATGAEVDLGLGSGRADAPESEDAGGASEESPADAGSAGADADDPPGASQRDASEFPSADAPEGTLTELRSEVPPAALIDTPLPAEHPGLHELYASLETFGETGAEADAIEETEPVERAGAGAGHGLREASIAEYRARLERYRPEIDEVRDAWREVLRDRVRAELTLFGPPVSEGSELHTGRLAATVAEASAGVPRPRAFRERGGRARSADDFAGVECVLVLDRSSSMGGGAAELCADAALVVIESLCAVERDIESPAFGGKGDLGITARSACIVFGDEPAVVKRLREPYGETARAELHAKVRSASGTTLGAGALAAAEEELSAYRVAAAPRAAQGGAVRLVVFVSDGGATDAGALAEQLRRMRAAGTRVVGIGVGAAPGMALFGADALAISGIRELPGALAGLLAGIASGARSAQRSAEVGASRGPADADVRA